METIITVIIWQITKKILLTQFILHLKTKLLDFDWTRAVPFTPNCTPLVYLLVHLIFPLHQIDGDCHTWLRFSELD